VDVDATEVRPLRRRLPGAAQEIDVVTARHQACEDFPEMKLGPAGLGIFVVLPVEHEYPH
jgi:hypothetical protein